MEKNVEDNDKKQFGDLPTLEGHVFVPNMSDLYKVDEPDAYVPFVTDVANYHSGLDPNDIQQTNALKIKK